MKANAVVMRKVGGPEVLAIEQVELAPLAAGELRIRSLASAINHSDLEIRAGNWNIRREPRFPYVPGLEVVGDVVEIAPDVESVKVGDRVWTAMQGLGGVRAERDGGYAEYVTVSAAVVAPLPKSTDPVAFAAAGLAGVTAIGGLFRIGPLQGKTIVVTGPKGGVGALAVLLAEAAGAKVVGIERGAAPEPNSADAVLDVVAGDLFPALVGALRKGGKYCIVGAIGGGDVKLDAWSLLGGLSLTGYSTEDLDGVSLRKATKALLTIALPAIPTTVMLLDDVVRAHTLLESRELRGRVVLVPTGTVN